MKLYGTAMWVFGLLLYGYATFVFEPSVASYSSGFLPDRVVNLDLQQRQLLLAMAGLTLFLAGAVVHALGELTDARVRRHLSAQQTDSQEPSPIPIRAEAELEDPEELMARYDIRREGEFYVYGTYRYTDLRDAVSYARSRKP